LSISIPQPFRAQVVGPIGPIGPITLSGIPDPFTIKVANPLPKIGIGVDPLSTDSHIAIDPLRTDSHIAVDAVGLNIALDRIPDVRAHLPANFAVSLCVFGVNVLSVRLCGEAQVITEPYRPNPCERCSPRPEKG
jgi:hypothetical protein